MPSVTLANPGNQINFPEDAVSIKLLAFDSKTYSGNAPIQYSASNLPAGLEISSHTGVISGTVDVNAAVQGPFFITITAQDMATNESDSQTFSWSFVQENLIVFQADQFNNDGDAVSAKIINCNATNDALSYSVSGLPEGLNFDQSSGYVTGTIAYGDNTASPYAVTITATDSNTGEVSETSFTWNVDPLAVSVVYSLNQANLPSDQVNLGPVYVSTSDNSSVTFSATGLPSGLSINASTGVISGTIASNAESNTPYQVTITATPQDSSQTVIQTISWTVNKLYLLNPGDQLDLPGDAIDLTPTSADATGGTPTFSATGLPAGLSINSSTGRVTGTITGSGTSTTVYCVTITETDGSKSASQTISWTVQPIIFFNPGDQFNLDGDEVDLELSASVPAGDAVTYSASELPTGLSINSTTGAITGTIADNAFANGPYTTTITATDTISGAALINALSWNLDQQTSAVQTKQPQETDLQFATRMRNSALANYNRNQRSAAIAAGDAIFALGYYLAIYNSNPNIDTQLAMATQWRNFRSAIATVAFCQQNCVFWWQSYQRWDREYYRLGGR